MNGLRNDETRVLIHTDRGELAAAANQNDLPDFVAPRIPEKPPQSGLSIALALKLRQNRNTGQVKRATPDRWQIAIEPSVPVKAKSDCPDAFAIYISAIILKLLRIEVPILRIE
ncbi:MAG: hypothetical protein KGJ13_02810 [Patescibacteria group bacterium]|nr:hypothetical protein [Patescibacteria group bacterium]